MAALQLCRIFLVLNVSCSQVESDLLEDGYHGDVIGEVTPDFVLENVVSEQNPCNVFSHRNFFHLCQKNRKNPCKDHCT